MTPINYYLFVIREITKQMLLIEDLLANSSSCSKCIRKHFLLMEALAEEVPTHSKWSSLAFELAILTRKWQIAFSDGVNSVLIVEKIGKKRKELVEIVFRSVI